VPSLIPGDADERAGSLHGLAGLEGIDYEPLHEQSEAAVRLGPRNLDLHNSVLRALDPWNTGMDECVELAGVEMPPLPLGGVVVAGQLTATGCSTWTWISVDSTSSLTSVTFQGVVKPRTC
jgi:hypothetical protein